MANEKKMDESAYGSLVKEVTAVGELLRTHQDEKQAVMDEFDKEKIRFRQGKISKKAVLSSVKKVNKELASLDRAIRKDIAGVAKIANQIRHFTSKQSPRSLRAKLSGVHSGGHSSAKKHRRKK